VIVVARDEVTIKISGQLQTASRICNSQTRKPDEAHSQSIL